MFRATQAAIFLLVLTVFALMLACGPESPEEKVAQLRSRYSANLNGFVVKQEPLEATAVGEEEEYEEEGTEGAQLEAGEVEEIEEIPLLQDVVLDIVVRHDSYEKLPGLTLDVSQGDASGQEKGHWRIWVDTSELEKGPGIQITHVLEDVDYEAGDGFHVEVRHPIPPEERDQYREFSIHL